MADGGSGEVGFTSPDSTGKLTDVWWTYGHYVMVKVDEANFYAEQISGAKGWYTLSWEQLGSGRIRPDVGHFKDHRAFHWICPGLSRD
jgi:hypothetical protein